MTKQLSLDDVLEITKLFRMYEQNVSNIKKLARTSFADVVYSEGSPSYDVRIRIGPEAMQSLLNHLHSQNKLIIEKIEIKYQVSCAFIDKKINLVP